MSPPAIKIFEASLISLDLQSIALSRKTSTTTRFLARLLRAIFSTQDASRSRIFLPVSSHFPRCQDFIVCGPHLYPTTHLSCSCSYCVNTAVTLKVGGC